MEKLNILTNLIGERITVLKSMELVPYRVYGTLEGFFIGNYAQYKNVIHMFIKPYRKRKIERIIIMENEHTFIFKGLYENTWKKDKIDNNLTNLVRISYEDVKNDNNFVFTTYNNKLEVNTNIKRYFNITTDFICNNDISPRTSMENGTYINYIKTLLHEYNAFELLEYAKNEGY